MTNKASAKSRILSYLTKVGQKNTMTSTQARKWFGVSAAKRIYDLREEGYPILTISRNHKDGSVSYTYAMDQSYFTQKVA